MSNKKLLVVFGITGNQGGSVAHEALTNPILSSQYTVRGIARNISAPAAQALASLGAELVQADMDDPSTLPAALKGAHTVFAVTVTYYDGTTKANETRQAKAVVDEAINQGAQYLIWSSMSHPSKITNGVLTGVDHFDVKAEIEQYIRSLPIKSSFYAPGAFVQNWRRDGGPYTPRPAADGSDVLEFTTLWNKDTKLPLIDIRDSGKFVAAVLADPDKYEGKVMFAAEKEYSTTEICEILSRVEGKKVVLKKVPDEVFKGFLPEGPSREMYFQMNVLFRDFNYFGPKQKEEVEWAASQAVGKLRGLEEFLREERSGKAGGEV